MTKRLKVKCLKCGKEMPTSASATCRNAEWVKRTKEMYKQYAAKGSKTYEKLYGTPLDEIPEGAGMVRNDYCGCVEWI